jgi:subfamily B ATP-binding cassette protein MsbA
MIKRPTSAYWRLLGYLRPYGFPFVALAILATLVLSATNGVIPFAARRFFDQMSSIKDLSAVKTLSIEILGLFLIRALANFVGAYLSAWVEQRVALDLRADLNNRLQRLPLSFFNRTSTGPTITRVISDVALATSSATDDPFSIIGDGTSLIALIGAALILDWKLALIAFVVFPAAIVPILRFSKYMRRTTRNAQQQLGGLQALLQETIQGNRVVKAFGMEEYERRRFDAELRRLFRTYMKAVRIKSVTSPMVEVMAAFGIVAVLWYGTSSVINGTRTLASFGAFFTAILLVYEPFKRLSRTNNSIQQGMAAAERVFELMDEPTDVPDPDGALELAAGRHEIEFRKVSFRYSEQWVLRDINLKVAAGEVVALVGMSGGGKSTLADLIPRFYDPQQGSVAVDGVDVRRYSLQSLRSAIGLVTQHTFLFNDTIRANIAYGSSERSLDDIVAAGRLANADQFIRRLSAGYETVVGELGVRLSGGERQRIAIARALLKNAPILILDEATSSLDSEAERLVQEALEHLMENRTTLVIAHRLSTVRRADRIAVIVDGRVIEEGNHDALFALGREYRKLHDLQFRSVREDEPDTSGVKGELIN